MSVAVCRGYGCPCFFDGTYHAYAMKKEIKCIRCDGLGLIPGRDQWGFGIPCPTCDGTGVKP